MALEVVSRSRPDLLEPHADALVGTAERESVAQAKWHLAETFARVALDRETAERAIAVQLRDLGGRSRIVTHCAVLALGVLGRESERRKEIADAIRPLAKAGKGPAKAVAAALRNLEVAEPPPDSRG
jgi:hypothetical protein